MQIFRPIRRPRLSPPFRISPLVTGPRIASTSDNATITVSQYFVMSPRSPRRDDYRRCARYYSPRAGGKTPGCLCPSTGGLRFPRRANIDSTATRLVPRTAARNSPVNSRGCVLPEKKKNRESTLSYRAPFPGAVRFLSC